MTLSVLLSDFHISVTLAFIPTTGRAGVREHTVLSPGRFWKYESEHLRATCPTHHMGTWATTQLISRVLTSLGKYHHCYVAAMSHTQRSPMQIRGNCVWFRPPKGALQR